MKRWSRLYRPALGAGLFAVTATLAMAAGRAPGSAAARPRSAASAEQGYQVLERSCFKCHGEGTQLSGLDLRTRELALRGGKHGAAIVPGSPAKSRLYQALTGKAEPRMPPTGSFPEADVQAVRAWIAAGARYPAASARAGGESGKWWAFRPVKPKAPPAVKDPWIRNPVDTFLLSRMREQGVRPSPPADRVTLIRRATFDLHGLPPTPDEIEAFVNDRSPDAWEKVVDRLLASPRYGERYARHWLDLARYAESNGFKADETRPNAWRYRDYVIRSFNQDKPYDRFVREQVAGDELYPEDLEARIATGFNRHWADESNAKNISLRRQEILNDMTDTTASVFLGLTVGCARCHDHKYDPITHRDYYSLQAFFAAAHARDDLPLVPRDQLEAHRRQMARWEEETRPVRSRMAELEAPYREKVLKENRAPFTPEVQAAIDTPPEKRTALQWQLYLKAENQITLTDDEVGKAMKGEVKARWDALRAEMEKFTALKPPPLPLATGIADVSAEAPRVHVLSVGVYNAPREEVQPAFPSAVAAAPPVIRKPASLASTGRRAALAEWLASPQNPLTARVMVNRVWQWHFGRGLVPSANDFGKAGEGVTHPELLDWLASWFASPAAGSGPYGGVGVWEYGSRKLPKAQGPTPNALSHPHTPTRPHPHTAPLGAGWSIKQLHRLLMTSAAYRQSSALDPAMAAKDPDNRLLWRYRRWRLEGEAVRDACLMVSGTLNPSMYGPSVFPELPEGVSTRGGWPVTQDEAERNRRSVYVFVRRNLRYPLFEAFDFPDTHEPCARRSVTNTAPQALILFNSELALKPAMALAGRLLREAPSPEARVERAYRLAFGRTPESVERDTSLRFLQEQARHLRSRAGGKEPLRLPTGMPAGADPAEGAALVDFCHALLNANEFLYVD